LHGATAADVPLPARRLSPDRDRGASSLSPSKPGTTEAISERRTGYDRSAAWARYARAGARFAEVETYARRLNADGYTEAAYKLLCANWKEERARSTLLLVMVDTDFRLGKNREAYETLQQNTAPWSGDSWLRASFAAALMGEVYEGQREYCMQFFNHGQQPDDLAMRAALPQGEWPQAMRGLSCLAIANHSGDPDTRNWYLEQAYRYCGPNPYVNYQLGEAIYAKQPQRALKLAEDAMHMGGTQSVILDACRVWCEAREELAHRGLPVPANPR